MYQTFYGFREPPFELTPNPRFLFLTPRHREALAHLRHGITAGKGIALLIGEAGTGKTTLVRTVLDQVAAPTQCVYLNNPTLTRDEFVHFLATRFELSAEACRSKSALLHELERKLTADRERGIVRPLVVDEAQSLPHELLEEIRLLANIETLTEKLMPVVLAGQPELAERLNHPSLRQLKQRVALRCELAPLSLPETASYIASRIRVAGGDSARVFTREAVMLIHERSGGIPRTISVLCDNALVSGFALDRRPVSGDVVLEVCRDFDLSGPRVSGAAASTAASSGAPRLTRVAATEPPQEGLDLPNAIGQAAPEKKRRFSIF